MRVTLTLSLLSLFVPMGAVLPTVAEAAPMMAPAPTTATAGPESVAAPAPAAWPAAPAAAVVSPAAVAAAAVAPAAPAASPSITFGWEALVDAYYLFNFTGDPKAQAPIARQFDTTANNFALNYAKLGAHADTDLVSLRLDLGAGHTAAAVNGSSAALSAGAPSDASLLYGNGFLVQQAFATVRLLPQVSLDAGKFVTSAGAEVIESNKNWLYSRSLLFFGIPLLHTGLRLNVAALGTLASPELVLSLKLVNGWNNDPDINSDKTYGLNITYTPSALGLTAAATTYVGKEASGQKTQFLVDGVLTKDFGSLSFGVNLDYFKLDTVHWIGVAAMGRFILNDSFNLALRGEYINSKNGYAYSGVGGLDGSLYEVTGQGTWTVAKHYELRLEFRADMSDKEIFSKGSTPRKNQVTGLLAALAYF